MTTSARVVGMALALALVASACGQKAGVHVEGGTVLGAPATTTGTDTAAPAQPGAPAATATDAAAPAAGSTTAPTAGGASTAPSTSGATPTQQPQAGASQPTQGQQATQPQGQEQGEQAQPDQQQTASQQVAVRGSDRTGVTADKITVGVHAPATGAAPLPTTSFELSRDLYWRNLFEREGGSVLGRTEVEVAYRDDRYSPDAAVQVCRELAASSFLVSGGGGTDQIQACGRLAETTQFPYFSAGVTEAGLEANPWYYAVSMTYRQQGPVLASYVRANPDGIPELGPDARIGTVITDTPNFDDALSGWLGALEAEGLESVEVYRHPKGDTSWYAEAAKQMKDAGANVIYILTAPVDYIQFANVSNERLDYNPHYLGVGVSMGLNAILVSGCGDPGTTIDQATFLSPFPGLDFARANTPEFFEAGEEYDVPTDDIAYTLWGIAESLRATLDLYGERYGNDLTREDFRDHLETMGPVQSEIFSTVQYSPTDHFGADSAHMLQADCASREYKTLHTFKSGF